MKSIYLSLFIIFLFSCGNPVSSEKEKVKESNEVQKFNFEVVDVVNHTFYITHNYYQNRKDRLGYSFKARLVNNSGCKLSGFTFYNSIDLIFPNKTFVFTGENLKDGQYNPPWLPNDTIEFDFSFDSWATPEHLEYNPDTVFLYIKIDARDIIGNEFYEKFAIYNIMEDWVDFQSTYKNKQK
jgi:hypothetical protein